MLVCEKSGQVGGTGSTSAGTLWIPGNHQSRDAGFSDSAAQAETYLDALVGNTSGRELRTAFLKTGPAAIDWLERNSALKFLPCGRHPDYRSNMKGAAVAGRAIIPEPFDGRLLGADFAKLRPPIPEYMLFGGMMVAKADIPPLLGRFKSLANFAHAANCSRAMLLDRLRYPRGTRLTMGNALTARLFYSLKQARHRDSFQRSDRRDRCRDGRVAGAKIAAADGEIYVKARKGVVLATGGYGHNAEYREAFMAQPTPVHSMASEFNQGDGVAIGEKLGARIAPQEHRRSGLWTPASVTPRADGSKGLYPHLLLDRAKPGLIAVERARRALCQRSGVVSRLCRRHVRRQRERAVDSVLSDLRRGLHQKIRPGVVYPGARESRASAASRISQTRRYAGELAAAFGIDAEALRRTVARHNGFRADRHRHRFRQGRDRAEPLQRRRCAQAQSVHRPDRHGALLRLEIWPADIAVSTGLSTDADARVLDQAGQPIAGLYACGNDMASMMRGSYPGPGTTLGPGMVFAYRAATHAAGKEPLEEPIAGA